ncbi:Uncharacterized protein TCM_018225 [Theobroma cacao]|uniref:Uncharacterized protein n=1 Tax=Theobroma cacao TaxID=3641 RepID=A0A061EEG3_THECC|nr:Uncharacterized protein TCM_018225 [Theobroma cacao]
MSVSGVIGVRVESCPWIVGAQCKSRTEGYLGPYFIRNLLVLMMYKWISNHCLVVYRLEGAPIACTMSRREGSPDTSYSIKEGSLDFIARSRYMPEGESVTSNPTQISSGSVPLRGKPLFKSLRSLIRLVRNEIDPRKKNMNKMEKRTIS